MRKVLAVLSVLLTWGCQRAPETEHVTQAPLVWEGTVASFDGTLVSYAVRGEDEPALVFIHCWGCDRTYWSSQVEALDDRYKVVTLDLPGHGEAGMDRSDWTLAAYGRDVETVVEALDLDRVILIGHSMGGPVALEATQLMPERVIGIVAVDTLQDVTAEPDREGWQELITAYEADFVGTCRGFIPQLFPEEADAELVQETVEDTCSSPPELSIELLREFSDWDATASVGAVADLGIPIRAINGTVATTDVEGNRTIAPDYDAVIMKGVGHYPMLERPEELNRLLQRVVGELTGGRTSDQ